MSHEVFMQRCLDLARLGMGRVSTNPLVGCVIVHRGKVVAEGYHRKFGGPHAEVEAVTKLPDSIDPGSCTVYVNLEPCSHHGKTPPCADMLIQKGFRKVVVGTPDSFSEVSGRGIKKLEEAGVEVINGILPRDCRELNIRFFTFHEKKRPYVILKWAQSADGFIAPAPDDPDYAKKRQLSGDIAQRLVHKWRSEEDAILVGARTAALDNPRLDARFGHNKNPLRVVLDWKNSLPSFLNIFNGKQDTLILNTGGKGEGIAERVVMPGPEDTRAVLSALYDRNVQSVIVEGGLKTLLLFVKTGLWDEARILVAPVMLQSGTSAPFVTGRLTQTLPIGNDNLNILLNR